MNSFLNDALKLNSTTFEDLYIPNDYITTSPEPELNLTLSKTNAIQKYTYFLITNGIRSLRQKTDEAEVYQGLHAFDDLRTEWYIIILIVSLLITLSSIGLVFYQIWQTENI